MTSTAAERGSAPFPDPPALPAAGASILPFAVASVPSAWPKADCFAASAPTQQRSVDTPKGWLRSAATPLARLLLSAAGMAAMLLGVVLAGVWPITVRAAEISGAGSTFVYPILSEWADAYRKGRGVTVTYRAIGSAGGINQIKDKAVDFGASDAPLSLAEL